MSAGQLQQIKGRVAVFERRVSDLLARGGPAGRQGNGIVMGQSIEIGPVKVGQINLFFPRGGGYKGDLGLKKTVFTGQEVKDLIGKTVDHLLLVLGPPRILFPQEQPPLLNIKKAKIRLEPRPGRLIIPFDQ